MCAMTRDEARAAAEQAIRKLDGTQFELMIVDKDTMERAYGWVFFYQTKLFVETGNFMYALGGNGPVVVEHESGRVTFLGTGPSVEAILGAFEAKHGLVGDSS